MSLTSHAFRRIAALTISAGVGVSLLAACGSGGTDAAAKSPASNATSEAGISTAKKDIAALTNQVTWPAVPALAHPANVKGKTIMVLPFSDNIPAIHGMRVAAEAALSHLGATVTTCDGKLDPSTIASCLQQASTQHDAAVLSVVVDYAMAPNAFQAAEKAGVKVLIGGEPADAGQTSGPDLAFYDNTGTTMMLEQEMSEAALADKGADANVLWLKLTDSAATTAAATAGIDKVTALCPSCGLATTDFTTANLDKLPSAVSAALVSHPNTNVVIVPVDSFVSSVIQGVASAGYTNKVEVVSGLSDLAGLQRVKAGQQADDLGVSVVYEGYQMANALMQLLSGDPVTKTTSVVARDFTKSNVGSLSLTDDAYGTTQWFGDDSFEQSFYKSWGMK